MDYLQKLPIPSHDSINSGLHSARPATMVELLGNPRSTYTQQCQAVTNPKLKAQIVKENVGPFIVRGHRIAVGLLKQGLAACEADHPDLVKIMRTDGMLCPRLQRGSESAISNHSWGCAVDITVGGILVPFGADYVLQGLLTLYHYLHQQGFFWGAGFSERRADPMHFELANETAIRLFAKS